MKQIFTSASKMVFIILTIAEIVGLFYGLVDPKDFQNVVLMVFAFYFANKGETSQDYAGK